MNIFEVVFIREEAPLEVSQTEFKEYGVVITIEYRVRNVADEVFKERSHDYVDDLTDFEIDLLLEGGGLVVLLKVHAAGDVLLCGCFVQLP